MNTEANKNIENDWWDELSDCEKSAIDSGIKQLDEGKGMTHEDVIERYPKYFVR